MWRSLDMKTFSAASPWLRATAPRDEMDEKVNQIVPANLARRGWETCVFSAVLITPFFMLRFVKLLGPWIAGNGAR